MDKENNPKTEGFNNNKDNPENAFTQNYYGYQASNDVNRDKNTLNNDSSTDKGQDRDEDVNNSNETIYLYRSDQKSNETIYSYKSDQKSNVKNRENTNQIHEQVKKTQQNFKPNYLGQNQGNKKKDKNILIFVIGGVLLILIAFLAFKFLFTGSRTISAKEAYSRVIFKGIDGRGYLTPEFDENYEEKLYGLPKDDAEDLKIVDWLKDPKTAEIKIKEKLKNHEDWVSFFKSFETKIDGGRNGELKNGEKLKLYFTADAKKAKNVGLKVSSEPFEVTVEGLKKIRPVSVIDSIKVNFKGENGSGLASYEIIGDAKKWADKGEFYVTINPLYGVKNGEEVKLTISPMNSVAEENGRQIKAESKQVKVTGLSEISDFRLNNHSGKINLESLIKNINKSMPKLVEKQYLNSYYWADKALVKGDGWTNQCNYQATDVYLAYDDQKVSSNIFKTILKIDTSGTITNTDKNSKYKKNEKIKTTKFVIFSGYNLNIKEDGSLIGGNLKLMGIFDSRTKARNAVIKTNIPQTYKIQSLNS